MQVAGGGQSRSRRGTNRTIKWLRTEMRSYRMELAALTHWQTLRSRRSVHKTFVFVQSFGWAILPVQPSSSQLLLALKPFLGEQAYQQAFRKMYDNLKLRIAYTPLFHTTWCQECWRVVSKSPASRAGKTIGLVGSEHLKICALCGTGNVTVAHVLVACQGTVQIFLLFGFASRALDASAPLMCFILLQRVLVDTTPIRYAGLVMRRVALALQT